MYSTIEHNRRFKSQLTAIQACRGTTPIHHKQTLLKCYKQTTQLPHSHKDLFLFGPKFFPNTIYACTAKLSMPFAQLLKSHSLTLQLDLLLVIDQLMICVCKRNPLQQGVNINFFCLTKFTMSSFLGKKGRTASLKFWVNCFFLPTVTEKSLTDR